MISRKEALDFGFQAIQSQRISHTPLLDASLLLCKTASCTREQLYSASEVALSEEEQIAYHELVRRCCAGEPVAYIVGRKEFYGHPFTVTPAVLIPRPDTEILVETAIRFLFSYEQPRVLDIGCGSGCIGISVALAIPEAVCMLSDIFPEALAVARQNSMRLLGHPLACVTSDLFSSFQGQRFDMIVSNPPYLADSWYEHTSAQVKREPRLALVGGGEDGLDFIRRIIGESVEYLEEGGILALECDDRQHDAVLTLMRDHGFTEIGGVRDLAQLRRVAWGRLHV